MFSSLKQIWRTLRFRLAVWNAVVVIATAMVLMLGLRQGVHWTLLYELDQLLSEDLQEISLALAEHPDETFDSLRDELNRKALGHKHHGWFVQLLDWNHEVVWSSLETPAAPLPAIPFRNPLPQTVNQVRLMQRDISAQSGQIVSIRVGASLKFLNEDVARLDRLMLLASAVILVIAPLLGYWLAGRTTHSIGAIIQTASRLRPSRLDERLPIRGTGDELDQLAGTVNRMLDRIARDLQYKREFLSNSAHELRSPLAAIRSSVEVALGSPRTEVEYVDLLEEIIDQGTSLETLINQLLLINESEAEGMKLIHQNVRLDEVVQRAVDMFAGVAESRDQTLIWHPPGPVVVDGSQHLLRQLANNLLDNALKYTPREGTVVVTLQPIPEAKQVELTVSDTGIGIKKEDQPRVFDRFFRGDRSRTRFGETVGTGLGLSICQAVTMAHSGEIECHSVEGEGTTFRVLLPTIDPQ